MFGIPDVQILDTDHIINTLKAAVREVVLITGSIDIHVDKLALS